jgi:hypothetical protein
MIPISLRSLFCKALRKKIIKLLKRIKMEERREFRHDYISSIKKQKFIGGDVATILEKGEFNIKIKVKGIPYSLPYRDFIIVTKPVRHVY